MEPDYFALLDEAVAASVVYCNACCKEIKDLDKCVYRHPSASYHIECVSLESGFSLIECMMACGIMAASTLMLATIAVNNVKSTNTNTVKSGISELVQRVRYEIESNVGLTGNAVDGELVVKDHISGLPVLAKDMVFDAKLWKALSVKAANVSAPTNGYSRITVVATFGRDLKRSYGSPSIDKEIARIYCKINSGVIGECVGFDPLSVPAPVPSPSSAGKDGDCDHEGDHKENHHD